MAARLLALLLGMSVILTAHAELQPPELGDDVVEPLG